MEPYKLPIQTATTEFTEKKSRFISDISPVSSEEEALAFLNSIREKYREVSHNVYAYRIKCSNICRYSDAGEPSGTAGMPLLEVFTRQDIYDFCCVATRYFGGILLGSGGLIRAYAKCGSLALEASGVGLMREITVCTTTLPYSLYDNVKRMLNTCGVDIVLEDFGVDVMLKLSLASEGVVELERNLTELSAGRARITVEGTRMGVWSNY